MKSRIEVRSRRLEVREMGSLSGNSVKKFLKTEILGRTMYCFDEIGSTNEVAFELAKNGTPEGTVVISDSQTRGRGRLRRKWISPPGLNLYMSVVFRPRIQLKDAPLLTLVSSIAVIECIKVEGRVALIKWPNDVLMKGRKVSGILTETEVQRDGVDFVIVGIGVNLNMTVEIMQKEMGEIADTATSLREELGREIDRTKFAAGLMRELEVWYGKFLQEEKSFIIKEWMERWGDINRRVRVKSNKEITEGIASGIDENGYLLLNKDDGTTERIISGDVILL